MIRRLRRSTRSPQKQSFSRWSFESGLQAVDGALQSVEAGAQKGGAAFERQLLGERVGIVAGGVVDSTDAACRSLIVALDFSQSTVRACSGYSFLLRF